MSLVVQRIRTSWTKASRGGPGAAIRNAAPTAFALPEGLTSALHAISMRESDAFAPHMSVADLSDPGVVLKESDGLLRVHRPEVTPFGMPLRNRRPPAVRLAPGEWLRWQINHRFAGGWEGAWTYRLDTFNIAYCPTSPDVFLGTPTHHIDELAYLR
ncbi:hypothetical protein [Kitasatospora sp. NPDC093558]|uniref:hypothetical protein n=1 Tax=Kitasatospora sp. NPDC093558 TaxID=3155201 RepID=UPI003412B31D